jgi:SAM-dependent methyltransferase
MMTRPVQSGTRNQAEHGDLQRLVNQGDDNKWSQRTTGGCKTDTAGKASLNYPKPDDASTHPSPRTPKQNASWLIPRGVSKGNWDYVRSNHISQGYDEFLKGDPLTAADRQIINRYFPEVRNEHSMPNPIVADFGCGNGRTLAPLLTRGYRGLGIDLSIPMLTGFAENRRDKSPEIDSLVLVQANLVELDGIGDDTVDHGISLFSTLGMIEGARNRAAFLGHARRIIKPGGQFILHAHNVWFQVQPTRRIGFALS